MLSLLVLLLDSCPANYRIDFLLPVFVRLRDDFRRFKATFEVYFLKWRFSSQSRLQASFLCGSVSLIVSINFYM